jgi:26S proteasome regulatory subunit N7
MRYPRLFKAITVYEEAFTKSVGINKKMDILFYVMKLLLEKQNIEKLKLYLDRQKTLLDQGGDWEKKNRLKVYEGIYSLMIRDIKTASSLFLDCVSTFASPEVIAYPELVRYTVLVSIITLDRVNLKKKVLQTPQPLGATLA